MLSRPDLQFVARDPAIPGLPLVLDVAALEDRLRREVPGFAAEQLEAVYVRYKRGTSCLVAYRTAAARAPTFYAIARSRDAAAKLQKASQVSVAGHQAAFVLAADGIEIRDRSADAELPALAHYVADDRRHRTLALRFRHLPDLHSAELDALAYKPERRFVSRLDGDDSSAVLRLYSARGFTAAIEAADAFVDAPGLRVGKRLAGSRRHRALIVEWLHGSPLDELLCRADGEPLHVVARVGEALANLHRQDAPKLRAFCDISRELALTTSVASVSDVAPELGPTAERIAERVRSFFAASSYAALPVHGDFYARQVVVTGHSIGILDMDRAHRGDPAGDLGNFVAHLERASVAGQITPERALTCSDALLRGYGVSSKSMRERIRMHTAAALLRLASDPFRSRLPGWPILMEGILSRAAELAGTGAPRAVLRVS